jgi:hypothetical protein
MIGAVWLVIRRILLAEVISYAVKKAASKCESIYKDVSRRKKEDGTKREEV